VKRRVLRLGTAIAVVLAANLYVIRARDVAEELRAGDEAYSAACERLTASAAAAGSPGTVAHLLAALQAELASLGERHPRWYAAYQRDPAAYPCPPGATP
jgi:hypothetical protein